MSSEKRTPTVAASQAFAPLEAHFDSSSVPAGFQKRKNGKWTELIEPIIKSDNDKRDYRIIKLGNGLEACLIHDKEADVAAASLSVRVGSWDEPDEVSGIAHFCEHLLFQGSKAYPAKNDFDDYLSRNNGSSNAETCEETTQYYFSCDPKALEGAVDRFAGFFHSPLFSKECVDKELSSVDSEFRMCLQRDGNRGTAAISQLASKGHPFGRFRCGSVETLRDEPAKAGIDVRDLVIRFHQEHYSANLMKLCLLSNHSLDEMSKMVYDHFAAVSNRNIVPSTWPSPFAHEQAEGHILYWQSLNDVRRMTIQWSLPDMRALDRTKPAAFIGHLLGREGKGTLTTQMKDKGWINGLSAGPSWSVPGFGVFSVDIDLTQAGLAHRKVVAMAVFQGIRALRALSTQQLYDAYVELAKMQEIHFKYQEPGEAQWVAYEISADMLEPAPRTELLVNEFLLAEFDEAAIRSLVDLFTPEKSFFVLKIQKALEGKPFTTKERFFGTPYRIEPLEHGFLKDLGKRDELHTLAAPHRNRFIPTELHDVDHDAIDAPPMLLSSDEQLQLWFKRDATFWVPKSTLMLRFCVPDRRRTPRTAILRRLLTDLVEEALSDVADDAGTAGLSHSLHSDVEGLFFFLTGYSSEHLANYAKVVIEKFVQFKSDQQTFERKVDIAIRGYENTKNSSALTQAVMHNAFITDRYVTRPKLRIALIQEMSLDEVLNYRDDLLSNGIVQAYWHGSTGPDEAVALVDDIMNRLGPFIAAPLSEVTKPCSLLVPAGKSWLYRDHNTNEADVNSALYVELRVGSPYDRWRRVRVALICDILSEKFYNQFRTEEEIGYNVEFGLSCSGGVACVTAAVQTEWHPAVVDERVEKFLEWGHDHIAGLPDDEFEEHRQSIISGWLETFKLMDDDCSYHWAAIDAGTLVFNSYKMDVEMLRSATKQELLSIYNESLRPSAPHRARLAVHVVSQRIQPSWLVPASSHAGLNELLANKPTAQELRHAVHELEGLSEYDKWRADAMTIWPVMKEGEELIDDAPTFRSGLPEAAQPVPQKHKISAICHP